MEMSYGGARNTNYRDFVAHKDDSHGSRHHEQHDDNDRDDNPCWYAATSRRGWIVASRDRFHALPHNKFNFMMH